MKIIENKIPPPVVALLLSVAMWLAARRGPFVSIESYARVVGIIGFGLLALITGALGARELRQARTTINPVRPDTASSLVTTGIYRYTRNPMYVSLAALLIAWAFWLSGSWAFLGPVLFLAFITRFQILPEERALQVKFGREYLDFRQRVRRWI
jgi:protein-S-isoprenylcysteine O-methyltransferase Ste14